MILAFHPWHCIRSRNISATPRWRQQLQSKKIAKYNSHHNCLKLALNISRIKVIVCSIQFLSITGFLSLKTIGEWRFAWLNRLANLVGSLTTLHFVGKFPRRLFIVLFLHSATHQQCSAHLLWSRQPKQASTLNDFFSVSEFHWMKNRPYWPPSLPNDDAKFQPLKAKWCRKQFAERPKDGAFIGGVIYWSFINFI